MGDISFVNMWTLMSGFIEQLQATSAALCSAVLPVVWAGLAIQITWQGFNIMRGQGGNNHVLDVFAKSLRVMIVSAVALEAGKYNQWIVGMINGSDGLGQSILNVMFSDNSASPFADLDAAFRLGEDSYGDAEAWGLGHLIIPHLYWIGFDLTFPGVTVLLANLLFFLLFIVLLVLAFADIVVNTFALSIILAVGPVFVACYAYEATAQYAQSWLQGALKWSFTNVVIIIVIHMFVFTIKNFVGTVTSSDDGPTIIAAIFGEIMAVIALIILCGKAHQIAADIIGGASISGFAQKLGQVATGAVKGGAKGFSTGGPMGALKGAVKGGAKGVTGGGGGGGGGGGKSGLGAHYLNKMGGRG